MIHSLCIGLIVYQIMFQYSICEKHNYTLGMETFEVNILAYQSIAKSS